MSYFRIDDKVRVTNKIVINELEFKTTTNDVYAISNIFKKDGQIFHCLTKDDKEFPFPLTQDQLKPVGGSRLGRLLYNHPSTILPILLLFILTSHMLIYIGLSNIGLNQCLEKIDSIPGLKEQLLQKEKKFKEQEATLFQKEKELKEVKDLISNTAKEVVDNTAKEKKRAAAFETKEKERQVKELKELHLDVEKNEDHKNIWEMMKKLDGKYFLSTYPGGIRDLYDLAITYLPNEVLMRVLGVCRCENKLHTDATQQLQYKEGFIADMFRNHEDAEQFCINVGGRLPSKEDAIAWMGLYKDKLGISEQVRGIWTSTLILNSHAWYVKGDGVSDYDTKNELKAVICVD